MTDALMTDAPLSDPSEDRLGRARFAQSLAESVLALEDVHGFVFGLQGPWGCGKTTLLNFVEWYLKHREDSLVIVRFNPWWFSGQENLLRQFFAQFSAAIKAHMPKSRFARARGWVRRLVSCRRLRRGLHTTEAIAGGVGQFEPMAKAAQGLLKFGRILLDPQQEDVQAVREDVEKLLNESRLRVLVVIDDVDRLEPAEVKQIFGLIKAVADFPRVRYLVSYDRNVAVRALEQVLGNEDAPNYLDKIVQVSVEVPQADAPVLHEWFQSELEPLLAPAPSELCEKEEVHEVFERGLRHFLRTPRDMKRYLSLLRATYPPIRADVNGPDFLAVQCLQLFAYEVYTAMRDSKERFVYDPIERASGQEDVEKSKAYFEAQLKEIPEIDREPARRLLKWLFLKVQEAFGELEYSDTWGELRQKRRISSSDVYEDFFRLSIPAWQVSREEMQAILDMAVDSQAFGAKLLDMSQEPGPSGVGTKVRIFLGLMEDYTDSIPVDHIGPMLRAFFSVGDRLMAGEEVGSFRFFDSGILMLGIRHQLLHRLAQPRREDVLLQSLQDAQAVCLVARTISGLDAEHTEGGSGRPGASVEDRTVSEARLLEFRSAAVRVMQSAASDGRLLSTPALGFVLRRWREWDGTEAPRKFIAEVLDSDEVLVAILEGDMEKTVSRGGGARAARTEWRVDPKPVWGLGGVEDIGRIVERCRRLMSNPPSWLTKPQKTAVDAFLREVERQGACGAQPDKG